MDFKKSVARFKATTAETKNAKRTTILLKDPPKINNREGKTAMGREKKGHMKTQSVTINGETHKRKTFVPDGKLSAYSAFLKKINSPR